MTALLQGGLEVPIAKEVDKLNVLLCGCRPYFKFPQWPIITAILYMYINHHSNTFLCLKLFMEVIVVDMLLIQGNNKVNIEKREWQEIKSNAWLAYRTHVEFNTVTKIKLHCQSWNTHRLHVEQEQNKTNYMYKTRIEQGQCWGPLLSLCSHQKQYWCLREQTHSRQDWDFPECSRTFQLTT